MNAFDTRINVVAASVGVPTPEQLENGSTPGVEVALTIGLQLPLSPGPGEPGINANLGVVRYELDRDAAIEFFALGLKSAEGLPDKSPVEIASSLSGVEQASNTLANLKRGA